MMNFIIDQSQQARSPGVRTSRHRSRLLVCQRSMADLERANANVMVLLAVVKELWLPLAGCQKVIWLVTKEL